MTLDWSLDRKGHSGDREPYWNKWGNLSMDNVCACIMLCIRSIPNHTHTTHHACDNSRVHLHYSCYFCLQSPQTTELASPESWFPGKYRVRTCESQVTFSLTTQYITLYMFCLKIPYVMYTADSLTLNSWPQALEIMPKLGLSNIFLP